MVVKSKESYYGLRNDSFSPPWDDGLMPIFACRFAETAGYRHILALANEQGQVVLQNTEHSQPEDTLEVIQCHNNAVFDFAWMPNTMKLVTVSGDHTAHLWSVESSHHQQIQVFSGHTRSVKTLAFRPQEHAVFATGARDGDVLIWDVRSNPEPILKLNKCHGHGLPSPARLRANTPRATSITGLVFQNDQTLISCGECDGNIKVWDLRKNYNVYKREPLPKHSIPYCGSSTKNGYTNLVIDDTQMKLYASCMDNVIYCYNVSTYNTFPEQRFIGHENSTFYIKACLSPDNKYLVSGSSDKNAYIWNVQCSEPVVKLAGHWAEVTCAAWCNMGDIKLATCGDDSTHKIWRIGKESYKRDGDLLGQAQIVPKLNLTNRPQWGSLKSPHSVKRKKTLTLTSQSKRAKLENTSINQSKRCLTDMMNAAKEHEDNAKRMKLATNSSTKHGADDAYSSQCGSPTDRLCPNNKENSTWTYSAKASASFMTSSKCYEHKTPKKISPKLELSPVKVPDSPKVRVVSFSTPTKNMPNFVLNGEAPHQRLMSPAKKKPETINWLTQLTKTKAPTQSTKEQPIAKKPLPHPTPPTTSQSNTLLKYFSKNTPT